MSCKVMVDRVLAKFAQGKPSAQPSCRSRPGDPIQGVKNTFWTDGQAIYSYRMKIAERLPTGVIWIVDRSEGPSRTTKAHIDACRWHFRTTPLEEMAIEAVDLAKAG